MKRIILIATVIALVSGCAYIFDIEEILLTRNDISLTYRGTLQVSYDPESCQLGYNDARNEYRVSDDRLANWFVISCSEKPVTAGQTLTADVVWTGEKGKSTLKNIPFKVEKTDDQGLVWLWNDTHNIGVIIKNI